MSKTLEDLIADVIWDNAEIIVEYGRNPYIDNADKIAELIIQKIMEYEVGRCSH